MIVVSDTSPLRYLAMIGGLDWLPELFGEVICPPEVIEECRHADAPKELREWASHPPGWLRIRSTSDNAPILPGDLRLDPGETAALCLAREIHADLVLMDERRGRAVAAELGLAVAGTLGVVVESSLCGHVSFEDGLKRLLTLTNFRISEAVVAAARARVADGPASH
jgi:predicted nucleic acid-binding protein